MFLSGWKEWTIAGFAALGVYSLYWIGGVWKNTHSMTVVQDSYEMQRVRNGYYGQFDLSNRQIEYTKVGGEATANPQANSDSAAANRAPHTQGPIAKKVAPKVDPKKAAVLKKQQQTAALKKKQELERRQKLAVRVVDSGMKSTLSDSHPTSAVAESGVTGPVANFQSQPAVSNPPVDGEKNQELKLSPGQWFSLLQAQPTATNAKKFQAAKKDIGEKNYYDILSKLLQDSQADRQKVALAVLNADVSVGTFQFVVKATSALQSNVTLVASLTSILGTYGNDRTRFPILAQALNSNDSQIVVASQSLIISSLKGIAAAKTPDGDIPAPPPIDRGNGSRVGVLSKNDFNVFKSALTKLLQSENSQVAQNARQIYSVLWQLPPGTQVAEN
jgi:hypothetical protein